MSNTPPTRSVFLTGGTGFLGTHLRDALAREGYGVTMLVRPGTDVDTRSNESVRRGDVTNPDDLSLDGCDIVVHLAAQTSVDDAIEAPRATWEVNATGTLNVLEAARNAEVSRVLLSSTASVYGPPEELPITEAHPLNPVEPYGGSKLAADRLARVYHRTYDLPVLVARVFNTFGPGQSTHTVVPAIVTQALDGDTVELGNLSPSRDFLYISDTIDAFVLLLERGKPGDVYNVGRGEDIEIGALAERIIDRIDEDVEIRSTAGHRRDDSVDIPRHVSDPAKIRDLGWHPEYGLDRGIEETIEWFRDERAE